MEKFHCKLGIGRKMKRILFAAVISLCLVGCQRSQKYFENEYFRIPTRSDLEFFEEQEMEYGKCVRIFQADSILDYLVCGFKEADSAMAMSLLKVHESKIITGLQVMKDGQIGRFGNYESKGLFRSFMSPKTGEILRVSYNILNTNGKYVFTLSRSKYDPLSVDFWEEMKKWAAAWEIKR